MMARPDAVRPELWALHPSEFTACYALLEFAAAHRPRHAPFAGPAGVLLVVIYARASKSFKASLLLASDGYGPQARMINRSLFEDMATGHWVKRNREAALPQLDKHGRYTMNRHREYLAKYDKLPADSKLPVLTPKENKKLRGVPGRRDLDWAQHEHACEGYCR
jgi:hypothetical protein